MEEGFELSFKNIRSFFDILINGAEKCLFGFRQFEKNARKRFNSLDDIYQSHLMSNTLKEILEETPIRVLKKYLSDKEYNGLIEKLNK